MNDGEKVVIITGGSAGIGYAAAKLFLEKDCRVVILSTNEEKGLRAQERLSEFGGSDLETLLRAGL